MAKLIATVSFYFLLSLASVNAEEKVQSSSLSKSMPDGALIFFETSGLSEFLKHVRDSIVFKSLLASGDLDEIKSTHFFKEAASACRILEFILRTNIWDLSDKFLNGRLAIAAYPASEGDDPEIILLIRPSEPSNWLKNRIRFAPLLRLGIKRIGRVDFGKQVFAYRTRRKKENATFFALNDEWILVATNELRLKETACLLGTEVVDFDAKSSLNAEPRFVAMTHRMGEDHLARVFLNTSELSKIDDRFGIPDKIDDPVLALFLGGAVELIGHSSFTGFTLDYGEGDVLFKAGMDAGGQQISEENRIFFSGDSKGGISLPPKVPGYIAGVSIYRPFKDWYQKRDKALKSALIPGLKGFEGNVGELLLGDDEDKVGGFVGDGIIFVSAQAKDAGVDEQGIKLPGFGFIIDLARLEGADAGMKILFEAMLSELEEKLDPADDDWSTETELYHGIKILVARRRTENGLHSMTPASARVAKHYVMCSSRELCTAIIDDLLEGEEEPIKGKGMAFNVEFTELSKFFERNRVAYVSEFVRGGRKEEQAKEDYENLSRLLNALKSLSGVSGSVDGKFEFEIKGKLREDSERKSKSSG